MVSRRYVICDIEATGLDEEKEIIEIALITWENGKILDVFETLINPLRNVSSFIQDFTGVSSRELENAPKFYDVAEAIRMRLEGSIFVSHNTDFDLNLLRRKYTELGRPLQMKSFCTLKVAHHEIPGLKSYTLDALCSFFRIKIKNRHRAIGDAEATLELFKELLNLRLRVATVPMYLPQHEKLLGKIPSRPGLLTFKNSEGTVIRMESSFNLLKSAREFMRVQPEKKRFLEATEFIDAEVTGLALIAEFKKLLHFPLKNNWMIHLQQLNTGEKSFRIRPFKKYAPGLWYFEDYQDARKKLRELNAQLKDQVYLYREGGKSKEEILRNNQKVEFMGRDARFPAENLVLVGEGRALDERSFVLIRQGHVLGYGFTTASAEEIYAAPEKYLIQRFFKHLNMDLAARRYLQELKHVRSKNEGWRSLAQVS
jgi:DNA polymerase III subunit epsilon